MVAEKLLSVPDSHLSIADVAADSGFTDQANSVAISAATMGAHLMNIADTSSHI
jgi:hypothetical protein